MIAIHPNGTVETVPWNSFQDITTITNTGDTTGSAFTSVPLPDRFASGYSVFANDIALDLPRNPAAEKLTGYPELYGTIAVVSFEEAQEDDLIGYIVVQNRKAFEAKLFHKGS